MVMVVKVKVRLGENVQTKVILIKILQLARTQAADSFGKI